MPKKINKKNELNWFLERIGKKVYRDWNGYFSNGECCKTCFDACEHGIIIKDETHAKYLEMVQHDLGVSYSEK